VNLCEKWLQKYLFNKETRLLESIQMAGVLAFLQI